MISPASLHPETRPGLGLVFSWLVVGLVTYSVAERAEGEPLMNLISGNSVKSRFELIKHPLTKPPRPLNKAQWCVRPGKNKLCSGGIAAK